MKIGTIYKGKSEVVDIIFNRVWSMPTAWTFTIRPVKELLNRYVKKGEWWVDPFAGKNSPAIFTNDMHPDFETTYHLEALEFSKKMKAMRKKMDGILFDPPYSFRQISEHYKSIGMKATQMHTSMKFYESVKSELCDIVKKGGYVISFGWNSNGFGKARGFRVVEILMIAHGGSKNDTIVTVEQKI